MWKISLCPKISCAFRKAQKAEKAYYSALLHQASLVEVPDDDDDELLLASPSMPISTTGPTHPETIETSAAAAAAKDNALPASMPESTMSPCPPETIEAASDATNAAEKIFNSAVEEYNSCVAYRYLIDGFNYDCLLYTSPSPRDA